jgi:hypothetical protein
MHILTFDLEDWFHILDHPQVESPAGWENLESRVERSVDDLLKVLA